MPVTCRRFYNICWRCQSADNTYTWPARERLAAGLGLHTALTDRRENPVCPPGPRLEPYAERSTLLLVGVGVGGVGR